MKERLQKAIASAGITSRRNAELIISEGRVKVNGRPAKIGDSADITKDIITIDGKKIERAARKLYYMLYKPRGFVTTMSDERGRKTVSMLMNEGERVYPVGRLDLNSEGLILMTNDGDLSNKLMHPSHNVTKTYNVKVRGDLEKVAIMCEPMDIDGYMIQKPNAFILWQVDETEAVIEITIHEGRNRQIRKMCEICGLEVLWLKRVAIGELVLDKSLRPGKFREIKATELEYLRKIIK